MAHSTVNAGLLVAIFLPTVGLCLIIALVVIYWAWRRSRLRRRIQLTADPPGPAMQRYIIRNGKLVPAPPPRESPSRLGWSTPRRLSRYLSGLSTLNGRAPANTVPDDVVPAIPPVRDSRMPNRSSSRREQRTTAQRLTLWQEGKHGNAEEIPPLPTDAPVVASQPKRASLRIKTSLLRAAQLPPLMGGPDSARALPISPLSPERPSNRTSRHHTSPVMRQRRNLSGHSFLDPPSEEVLRSFLDPPSDEQVQEQQRRQQQQQQLQQRRRHRPPSLTTTLPPPPPLPPLPQQSEQQQQNRQREHRSPPLSPHQSPPLPTYHSPLQSRFYVEPQFDTSRLSRHTSRHPSRVPSRNWASISSISQIQMPVQMPVRHTSRHSPVSSLSETPPEASPPGPRTTMSPRMMTSPRSADTFFSESDSSNQQP